MSHLPLNRADLPVDTAQMARFLVGVVLAHEVGGEVLRGRIVETEAYVLGDASSHAFRGMTPRTRPMFGPPGHAYVYLIYGVWKCLNVSSEPTGIGAGVLLRALEPLEGLETMRGFRGGVASDRDLARGPGRLAQAMGVTLGDSGVDLCDGGPLRLERAVRPPAVIGESVRIGLTKEADRVLRFYERGSPFVSGPGRLNV